MKCSYCGHENGPEEKSCSKCGAQLPQKKEKPIKIADSAETNPAAETEPIAEDRDAAGTEHAAEGRNAADVKRIIKKVDGFLRSLPLKKILIIAVPVFVLLILFLVVLPGLKGSNFYIAKNSIDFFTDSDGAIVISGNNNKKFTIDGELSTYQESMDGSKAAVMTDFYGESGGTLWFVTTTNSTHIADDVLAYRISDSGKGVLYITDYDAEEEIAALYVYDSVSKKSSRVTDDAMYSGEGDLIEACISPDGRTVAYVSSSDTEDLPVSYIKTSGKAAELLGENQLALAVSDKGKYIYYIRLTEDGYGASFYVKSGKNENRLAADIEETSGFSLNKDYSQIIFEYEDKAYFSKNGGERTKIGNYGIKRIILPEWTEEKQYYGVSGNLQVCGVKSFSGVLIRNYEDELILLNSQFEGIEIYSRSSYIYMMALSSDGSTLLYLDDSSDLSLVDLTEENTEPEEIAEDIQNFAVSNDFGIIYYVNDDEELWCIKGSRDASKVSDDVSASYLTLPNHSKKVFFMADYSASSGGLLYYVNNGGKRQRVSNGDAVEYLYSTPASLFFMTVDSELYRSGGSEKFELFQDEVSTD